MEAYPNLIFPRTSMVCLETSEFPTKGALKGSNRLFISVNCNFSRGFIVGEHYDDHGYP